MSSSDNPPENKDSNNNITLPKVEEPGKESLIVEEPEAVGDQKDMAKHFNEMMGKLGDEYFDRVTKLAEQDTYTLEFKLPTGKKIKNPVTDVEEDEYSGWENKTIRKGKITAEEYKNIEILRGRYNKEKDQEKNAELFSKLYHYIAYVYFSMKYEDIKRANWDMLKPILDSANFATVYSMKKPMQK